MHGLSDALIRIDLQSWLYLRPTLQIGSTSVNEADTRATLIEPKLKAAGWTDRLVTREYYYQRDHQYAPGRIILVGDQVRHFPTSRLPPAAD
jgi:hypothetical protein